MGRDQDNKESLLKSVSAYVAPGDCVPGTLAKGTQWNPHGTLTGSAREAET